VFFVSSKLPLRRKSSSFVGKYGFVEPVLDLLKTNRSLSQHLSSVLCILNRCRLKTVLLLAFLTNTIYCFWSPSYLDLFRTEPLDPFHHPPFREIEPTLQHQISLHGAPLGEYRKRPRPPAPSLQPLKTLSQNT